MFFQEFEKIYNAFLSYFPLWLHPFISLALALLLIYSFVQVIKRNFVWIILLVLLLPASVPILKNILQGIVGVVKYLLGIS